MKQNNNILITIEGPDRVGKETQSNLLFDYISSLDYKIKKFEIPYKDKITYPIIYWMLRNGSAKKLQNIFQFIQFCNKKFFQISMMTKLKKYDFVIFDRWKLSSEIYGKVSFANTYFVKFLNKFIKDPDYTIILLSPPLNHEARDCYEKDVNFQKEVRKLYASVNVDNSVIKIFVNGKSIPEVHNEIIYELKQRKLF